MKDFESAVTDALEWKSKCRALEAQRAQLAALLRKARDLDWAGDEMDCWLDDVDGALSAISAAPPIKTPSPQ